METKALIIEFSASETKVCLTCQGVYMSSPSPSPSIHPVYGLICTCPVAAYVDREAVFVRLLGLSLWSVIFEEWGEMPEGFAWTTAPSRI